MLFGTCKIPTREAPCPVLGTSALAQATHTKKLDLEVKRTQASDNTADIKRNTAELVAEPQPKQTWSSSARHKDSAAILDCVFVPDCTGSYRFRPPDYPPNCWRLFVCHACTSHFPSQFFRAGKGMFVCSPLLLCMYISCSHGRCIC